MTMDKIKPTPFLSPADLEETPSEERAEILEELAYLEKEPKKIRDKRLQNFWKNLSYESEDIFDKAKFSFSSLVSDEISIELQKDRLINEIILFMELRNPYDLFKGMYIYSIQVVNPQDIHKKIDPLQINVNFPDLIWSQIKSGYLYHGVLYSLNEEALRSILDLLFSHSEIIEIPLKLSSAEYSTRIRIHIS